MPRSGPGWRTRELPVHCATQGLPGYALQGATVEGVVIAHGGPPTLGAQQHQRPAARAQNRRPRPPLPPSPLPPQRRHPQTRPGAAGDSELGADVRGELGEFWLRLFGHQSGILLKQRLMRPLPFAAVLFMLLIAGSRELVDQTPA